MSNSVPTILVIDNDDGLVAALATRLEHYGYRCITAESGAQGVAAFREQRIDLVITDLNMPAGNGIALVRAIQQISQVPIIIMTGFQSAFNRQLQAFANVTVMNKPFDAERLIDLVETELVMTGRTLPIGDDADD